MTFAYLAALPLSVELLGAMWGIVDGWRTPGAVAAALERFALPLACWGALWWIAGADAWVVMFGALGTVALFQVATFYAVRLLLSRPGLQTQSIETDTGES